MGRGREGFLNPSYFPPPHTPTPRPLRQARGSRARRTPIIRQCFPVPVTPSRVGMGLTAFASHIPIPTIT